MERKVKIEGFEYLLEPEERIIGIVAETAEELKIIFRPVYDEDKRGGVTWQI